MFHFVAELESIVEVLPGRVSMSKKVGLCERLVLQTQAGVEVERCCVELLANWRDLV